MAWFTKIQQRNGTNCKLKKRRNLVSNSLGKRHLNSVCTQYVCDKSENARCVFHCHFAHTRVFSLYTFIHAGFKLNHVKKETTAAVYSIGIPTLSPTGSGIPPCCRIAMAKSVARHETLSDIYDMEPPLMFEAERNCWTSLWHATSIWYIMVIGSNKPNHLVMLCMSSVH